MSTSYSGDAFYSDYLQHFGIIGMKWGKRNGPPYPLTERQLSSAERKAENLDKKSKKYSDKANSVRNVINENKKRKLQDNLDYVEMHAKKTKQQLFDEIDREIGYGLKNIQYDDDRKKYYIDMGDWDYSVYADNKKDLQKKYIKEVEKMAEETYNDYNEEYKKLLEQMKEYS